MDWSKGENLQGVEVDGLTGGARALPERRQSYRRARNEATGK
jgi:hypothetical protein